MNPLKSADATKLLKRELRKRIRETLSSLPQPAISKESEHVITRFTSSPHYKNASSLALYASMPHEFDTSTLLQAAFRDKKRVFLPRIVSKKQHKMVMLECNSMQELMTWVPNDWNIREPPIEPTRAETPTDVPVDIVIVPGIAFDLRGGRCGQGMGFYDRFLANYAACGQPMPRLVALTLSAQVVAEVPVSDYDWTVDDVVYGSQHESRAP